MRASDDELQAMFRLLNEIGIVAQLSGNAFERVMAPGMTLPQFVVLNHLARLGGHKTPLALARAMQVTKGTMTNTLTRLERAGYIAVTPDADDGRSKRVDITDAGRAARDAAIGALAPELAHLVGAMPEDAARDTLPLLQHLRQVLDARRDENG